MKRRDFLKAGSAAIATTGLAACGGGDSAPTPVEPAPTGNTEPTPAPIPTKPDPVGTPTPATTIKKTFYITDGVISLASAAIDPIKVYFKGFSSNPDVLNVPGESLIIREGDSVEITIINKFTTKHNFTIDNINRAGNKNITVSIDIAPESTEVVQFTAGAAGTYMYYDASNAPYHRLLGLHGALAVMPLNSDNELYSKSRTFVKQLFWVFNDIDPIWNNALQQGMTIDPIKDPFTPRYFTMNGLSGIPPGAPEYDNETKNSMHDPRTMLKGVIGDRTLIRCVNAGKMKHSVHIHANHMEWLPKTDEARKDVWEKDVVPLKANGGIENVIYPFEPPPDCVNPFNDDTIRADKLKGVKIAYPMHLHDEMTQTAAGGSYQFGAMTDIFYISKFN